MWDGEAGQNRKAPDDARVTIRAADGRAPDVFRLGAWTQMREYKDTDEVDFAIVGTGAGGGTLACRLAEKGFSVVALEHREHEGAGRPPIDSGLRARARYMAAPCDFPGCAVSADQ